MKNFVLVVTVLALCSLGFAGTPSSKKVNPQQEAASANAGGVVPAMVKFAGTIADVNNKSLTGVVGVTFLLYKDQTGGVPLWMETQNVQADKNGHYSVMLGSTTSHGLPAEAFAAGEARWLGVQPSGQEEQPRVVLVSVPYALKALDAETLGGRPASAFLMAPTAGSSASKAVAKVPAAAEQANEIVCSSATACKMGFVPLFASNGGSAKITDSIVKQTGTNVSIAGAESVAGNISTSANVSASGNVGARTVTTTSLSGGITSTMTGTGNSIAAVTGNATAIGAAGFTFGVLGLSASDTGRGVFGLATGAAGQGVIGETTAGGIGVVGKALPGSTGYGVWGEAFSGVDGVHGVAHTRFSGVAGLNDGTGGYGVWGQAFGTALDGVHGVTSNASGSGVAGVNFAAGDGVFGGSTGGFAGFFGGNVNVTGNLSKAGGSFKIDHPLDPANKYLSHSFVESPDMMNLYNGNVTTDAHGDAAVQLPDWFETLNRDFRYQLTVIGQFSQAIVAKEISNRQFAIKTDKPNVKVCWQVTGIRQDAWANAHRIPVEELKPEGERGLYIHPELFGAPAEKSITLARHPDVQKLAKERSLQQPSSANH
jgi:hypothetical protein